MLKAPAFRLVHYPAGLRQPAHAHDCASLSLLLAGSLYERVGRREIWAQAGQWCHKGVGVEHATVFGPAGATTLQLSLVDWPAQAPRPAWRWGCDAPVAALLWTLLGSGQGAAETEGLEDLRALLAADAADAPAPPWWPRAFEALCNGHMPIHAVAADCGVHRAHLVRVTQQLAGCAPVVVRQRARLGRTLARMAREPALGLSELALDGGFADQAHFSRECLRWLGQAPGRWRRRWPLLGGCRVLA